MSLINQMLRDLENRRNAVDRALPDGEEPPPAVQQRSSWRLLKLIVGGFALLGLIWLGLEFFPWQIKHSKPIVMKIADARSQVNSTGLQPEAQQTAAAAIPPEIASPSATVVAKHAAGDEPGSADGHPAVMVNRAAASVAASSARVSPAAPGYSLQLLNLGILETLNSARLLLEFEQLPEYRWQYSDAGQQQVEVRFRQAGMQAAVVIPQLKGPLLKQVSLNPRGEYLELLVKTDQKVTLNTLELPADQFYGHRLLVELSRLQTSRPAAVKAKVSSVKPSPEAKPAPQVKAKKLSKKTPELNREEQAALALRNALRQLGEDDSRAAETSLKQALALQPRLLDARLRLIDLLLKTYRDAEAGKLLTSGLELHPGDAQLRKKYARLLLAGGQLKHASEILQSKPAPEVGEDLEYHALAAALLQETGRHKVAAKSYQQLLKYRPREALWWLGLAISLEQSGSLRETKEAYRQAISLPGLRPDMQDFINNRLRSL